MGGVSVTSHGAQRHLEIFYHAWFERYDQALPIVFVEKFGVVTGFREKRAVIAAWLSVVGGFGKSADRFGAN